MVMADTASDGERVQATQGELFSNDHDEEATEGYRGTAASKVAGITYRQLDYWARKQILAPSIKSSNGSGSRRLYSFKDIVVLAVAKRLLDMGVNLQNVTNAIDYLLHRCTDDLEHMTIVCDGVNVKECSDGDEMLRIMQDGTPVFGISVSSQWRKVKQELAHESSENALQSGDDVGTSNPIEDLAAARMRKKLELQHEQRSGRE